LLISGLFVIRAKIPTTNSVKSSIWLSPKNKYVNCNQDYNQDDSSKCDRINLFDVINFENSNDYLIKSGLAQANDNDFHGFSGKLEIDPRGDFHLFTFEWRKMQWMSWSIDGKVYANQTLQRYFEKSPGDTYANISQPFDTNFYIALAIELLNLNKEEQANERHWATQEKLIVDYIKVYKRKKSMDKEVNLHSDIKNDTMVIIFASIMVGCFCLITITFGIINCKNIKKMEMERKQLVEKVEQSHEIQSKNIYVDESILSYLQLDELYDDTIVNERYEVIPYDDYMPMNANVKIDVMKPD